MGGEGLGHPPPHRAGVAQGLPMDHQGSHGTWVLGKDARAQGAHGEPPTLPPAPSEVPTLHLHSSSGSSLTLSWTPPERPNGVILDYEMKYFEKVGTSRSRRRP